MHIHHRNIVELLAAKAAGSVDRFVLLDAQDWMTDRQLNELWTEITRTAAPARASFSAPPPSRACCPAASPTRCSTSGATATSESHATSRARDRSAIYGGFHLYVKTA